MATRAGRYETNRQGARRRGGPPIGADLAHAVALATTRDVVSGRLGTAAVTERRLPNGGEPPRVRVVGGLARRAAGGGPQRVSVSGHGPGR